MARYSLYFPAEKLSPIIPRIICCNACYAIRTITKENI